MEQNTKTFPVAAAILGICLIATAFVAGFYFYKVKSLTDLVSVTGSAQRNITSDVVKWTGTISMTSGISDLNSVNTTMKKHVGLVSKYLKDNGITDTEITISPISVNPTYESSDKGYYGYGGGKISGYSLTQTIKVESNQVDKVTKLAEGLGELINQGVPFSSQPLEYYYSKISELKVDMLAEATKDAQNRARKIVESTGSVLGNLKSASMGVMQITPVNSTEVSDYGYYDTSSIQKQITAIVRASFGVK